METLLSGVTILTKLIRRLKGTALMAVFSVHTQILPEELK